MAGTSLARQLAALRTPGAAASQAATATYSGPFLFPEAEQHTSLAGLKEQVAESLSLLYAEDPGFARYSVLLEAEPGDKETDQLAADCLYRLCPHLLLRPAQYLLQWLVTRHRVHTRHTALLVFTLLPHHTYRIYQTTLAALDDATIKSLPWLAKFHQTCLPTSARSLHRQAASCPAFLRFLCDQVAGLGEQLVRQPDTRVHKQATLLVAALIGGLQLCGEVGEERLHSLLQIVLTGFKSFSPELAGLSSVLLGCLLPRVALREKAVTRLCRALAKLCRREATEDSLCLVLLLARTQPGHEGAKLVELVARHEAVINSLVMAARHSAEEETVDQLDSLVYSLATVTAGLVTGEPRLAASQEEHCLLSLLSSCTALFPLSEETAELVAETVLALARSLHKEDGQLKGFKESLAEIRSHLELLNPATFHSVLAELGRADVLFVPGSEAPTDSEVEVARILASDPLVNFFSARLLLKCSDQKSVRKIIKKNAASLEAMLGASTVFLASQLDGQRLETLLLNLLRVTACLPELQQRVVVHLCSEQVCPSLLQDLELLLLPLLLTSGPETVQLILSSHLASVSPLISLLSSLSPSSSMYTRALTQKLSLILRPAHLSTLLASPLLRTSPSLATLLLRLSSLLVVRPEQAWAASLASLLASSLHHLELAEESNEEDNVGLVRQAGREARLSWSAVLGCVTSLQASVKDTAVAGQVLALLPPLYEKGKSVEAGQVTGLLRESLQDGFLAFLLAQALAAGDPKLTFLCLQEADSVTCSLSPAQLQQQGSDQLALHVLTLLLSPKMRVQKQAFRLLPSFAAASSQPIIKELAEFFSLHKAEILDNVDNFPTLLARNPVGAETCSVLLKQCMDRPTQILLQMTPFFGELASRKSAENFCDLGLKLLEQGDSASLAALAELLGKLTRLLVVNLSSPRTWSLLEACLSSSLMVEVAGLSLPLARHLLKQLAACPATQQLGEEETSSLLAVLARLAAVSAPVEAARLVAAARPKPAAFLAQLKTVWGEEAFGDKTRGRQTRESTAGQESRVWAQTCWLLEALEEGLEQAADWSGLIRPVFVLLRLVADMEVEEGTYKLSLLLNVLLKLLTGLADTQLKKLESGRLEPELLVSLIRTSPNPDSRNTALRVLARCAVSDPDFILHNSITIFTFMGSHLLQVDSKRSFQVACESLDVLVPAMRAACSAPGRQGRLAGSCLGVLTTFVDSSKDIPGHRLTEFLVRLVRCLGDQDYLWVAALLLAKRDRKGGERSVTELFCKFLPGQAVEALLRLMVNTRNDTQQLRKMFGVVLDRKGDEEKPDDWDMLRLRSLQLTSYILSDKAFKAHVGSLIQGEEDDGVMEMINLLVEATILTIQQYCGLTVPMPARLKRNLVALSEKVLEQSLSLLPGDLFLQLAGSLLASPAPSVRLRALEVVSTKLSPPCALDLASLPDLLQPLVQLSVTEEHPHTQQLALLAVRQLAKLITDSKLLAEAAAAFTCEFLEQLSNPKVLGAAVLSCGDVLSALGPLAVTRVPLLVKWLLHRLETDHTGEGWAEKEVAVVRNSFLYCLQKLVEGFVGFLHPLLGRLTCLSCRLAGQHSSLTSARAASFLSCLATSISPHTVLPTATALLEKIWTEPTAVPPFVNFLAENCRRLERNQLSSVSKEFVAFFTVALGYRARLGRDQEEAVTAVVEQAVISAFLSVALRLSLEDFKPVYQRMVTLHQDGSTDQLVTMFRLTVRVGEKLKSLFGFGVESTALLVTATLGEERQDVLATAALDTVATVFSYNKLEAGSLTVVQYERLVTALLADWVLPCPSLPAALVKLAASTSDDTNWKCLHHQLLMALRDPRPEVRIAVLEVLAQCVTDRTDTYLPVLPDAVPFLQEILEDDDQAVETKCKDFIQHMETTFGQNIESYFV